MRLSPLKETFVLIVLSAIHIYPFEKARRRFAISCNLPSPSNSAMPADRNTRVKADPPEVILVSDGDEDPPTVEVGLKSCL